jgi:ATP-dependent DNA ligase
MLLSEWSDLTPEQAEEIENDQHAWLVQPKLDGCRALVHLEQTRVRITSRTVSEVTFRLNELQDNLPHLQTGWDGLVGTVIDGELLCPKTEIDTGSCQTLNALQATMAILATSSHNAHEIQQRHETHVRFHAFDILQHTGKDVTRLPLHERQSLLVQALAKANHPHVQLVPSYVINKPAIHESTIKDGGEGTVWKRIDGTYEPGRRVRHWIKRKRGIEVEAFVSGFKPGTPERGHGQLVGAIEFSIHEGSGVSRPIAWVSNWTDEEREAMTEPNHSGSVQLNTEFIGRRALVAGQGFASRSNRMRHARIRKWLD